MYRINISGLQRENYLYNYSYKSMLIEFMVTFDDLN
jgi:hypothetical protein